jgi:hypothetical protein
MKKYFIVDVRRKVLVIKNNSFTSPPSLNLKCTFAAPSKS